MDIKILQRIDDGHLSHFWYGGCCAEIKHNGYTLLVSANGDVIVDYLNNGDIIDYVKDKGNNGLFNEVMKYYIKNDGELYTLIGHDLLYIINNNWWECFVIDMNGFCVDSLLLDSDYLDDAIQEVKDNIEDILKSIKN